MGGTGVIPDDLPVLRIAGTVTSSKGVVEALFKNKKRVIAEGDSICVGETIQTAQDSETEIRMTDSGTLSVRSNTQLKIERYEFVGANTDNSWFDLIKGASRIVTGKIGKSNPQNDIIHTPNAVVGVRGTDHEVTVILASDASGMDAGTYDKVNSGITFIRTEKGEVEIHPNQIGYASSITEIPSILLDEPKFFHSHAGESAREGQEDSQHETQGKEEYGEGGANLEIHSGEGIVEGIEVHPGVELPEFPGHDIPDIPSRPEGIERPELPGM
jgi:hypothetical protein